MANIQDIVKNVSEQAKSDHGVVDEYIQLVVFNLDNEEYAVEIKDLQEIIKIPEITPIPGAANFIRGIFNLRGKIVVVLDLESRFALERQEGKVDGNIIIATVENNSFGITVDKVSEIIHVGRSVIQPTPTLSTSKINSDYIKGVVVLSKTGKTKQKEVNVEINSDNQNLNQSRLIILLDLPKMLSEKELMSIQEAVKI